MTFGIERKINGKGKHDIESFNSQIKIVKRKRTFTFTTQTQLNSKTVIK